MKADLAHAAGSSGEDFLRLAPAIITQQWTAFNTSTGANTTDVFKLTHAYDRDSNRLYADNQTQKGSSHKYVYDSLNRLTSDKKGLIKTDHTDTESSWTTFKQAWTLDPLGNPTSQDQAEGTSYEQSTYNAQNQIVTRKVKGNVTVQAMSPAFSDTTTESGIALAVPKIGPMRIGVSATIPGGADSGFVGYAFGYKSTSDYGQDVIDVGGVIASGPGIEFVSTPSDFFYPAGLASLTHQSTSVLHDIFDAASAYSNGTPSGRIGIINSTPDATVDSVSIYDNAVTKDMGSRWINGDINSTISSNQLVLVGQNAFSRPKLVRGLRLPKFQATFALPGGSSVGANFVFNAQNLDDHEDLFVTGVNGSKLTVSSSASSATYTSANAPTFTTGSTVWVQVTYDGSTLTVKAQLNVTQPSDGSWSSISNCYSASGFTYTSGMLGFGYATYGFGGSGNRFVDDLTIKSYTSSFDTIEVEEQFTIDGSGYVVDTLAYDNNGNLTFDGIQVYTYDAWNRLKTVAHGYREASSPYTLHAGQVFCTTSYDATGRRIIKAITTTGNLDCTYHYYLSGHSVIEERNGSDQSIKDHVWGLTYIDETVQTRINTNLTTPSWSNYYLMQDANFNVLGIVNNSGVLVERYEYSAYGQRMVFYSAGSDDPGCYTPSPISRGVITSGSVTQPYGINEIGHQGLVHDEQTKLIMNRFRIINSILGRYNQNDPLGYPDGINRLQYVLSNPINYSDFSGLLLDPGSRIMAAVANGTLTMADAQAMGIVIGGGTAVGGGTIVGTTVTATATIGTGIASTGTVATVGAGTTLTVAGAGTAAAGTGITAGTVATTAVALTAAAGTVIAPGTITGNNPPPASPKQPPKCDEDPCKNPLNIKTGGLSPADIASLTEYVCKVNKWLAQNGPQQLRPLTGPERATKDAATAAERNANPNLYPRGIVPGHVPDTGLSRLPNPSEWLPMREAANGRAGSALGPAVRDKKNVDCLTIDGKKPDCK